MPVYDPELGARLRAICAQLERDRARGDVLILDWARHVLGKGCIRLQFHPSGRVTWGWAK